MIMFNLLLVSNGDEACDISYVMFLKVWHFRERPSHKISVYVEKKLSSSITKHDRVMAVKFPVAILPVRHKDYAFINRKL